MIDDMTLQAMVMDELEWVPNVDAAHIGVSAKNGVVTLSGIVSTLAEKFTAEAAVRRVKGVRGIAEEIVVRPPSAHKWADEEIAERAVKILSWDVDVPDTQVQVKVEKGVVTLTGFVAHQFQKQAAEHDVRRLGGVAAVLDMIEVRERPVLPSTPRRCRLRSRPPCGAVLNWKHRRLRSRSAAKRLPCKAGSRVGGSAALPKTPPGRLRESPKLTTNLSSVSDMILLDKIRRIVTPDFFTRPCFGGPIYPTARMLLSGSDHQKTSACVYSFRPPVK